MSATIGTHFRITVFGESHGPAIGVTIDGLPAGFPLDPEQIARHMNRRAPGQDPTATARREKDEVRILSGWYNGRTTGAALTGIIENTNTRSSDYQELSHVFRPGHADYSAFVKYACFNDVRGGGQFSGRLTAPLVFAGSVARQLLASKGIAIGAHILSIQNEEDLHFDALPMTKEALDSLTALSFPVLHPESEAPMRSAILKAKENGDSVGGRIECLALGVPAGIGSPLYASVESTFAALAFSVPGVKAVSFGDGDHISEMTGSTANDEMSYDEQGNIVCLTNHNGGVIGGITNGMPVRVVVGIKPTPSIARLQKSVDVRLHKDVDLSVHGRHDPCIVPRAVVVIESILAITLCDLIMENTAMHAFMQEGVNP